MFDSMIGDGKISAFMLGLASLLNDQEILENSLLGIHVGGPRVRLVPDPVRQPYMYPALIGVKA